MPQQVNNTAMIQAWFAACFQIVRLLSLQSGLILGRINTNYCEVKNRAGNEESAHINILKKNVSRHRVRNGKIEQKARILKTKDEVLSGKNHFLFTQQQSSYVLNWPNCIFKQHIELFMTPSLLLSIMKHLLPACDTSFVGCHVPKTKEKTFFSKRRKETHLNQTLTTT
jgi:hypothetical protein